MSPAEVDTRSMQPRAPSDCFLEKRELENKIMADNLPDILSAATAAERSTLKELLGPAARIFGRYFEERADAIVEE
jgi:hypothetical protein